jgi:P27 family predicted phage terminase small subunit
VSGVEPQIPRAPAGLKARGRRFWRRVASAYELTTSEFMILEEVCRTLDSLDAMQSALNSEGVTVEGSAGQPRAHPVLVELRQQRVALGRLLSQLALPDEQTGAGLPSLTEARARRAAEARWRPHRAKGSADGSA